MENDGASAAPVAPNQTLYIRNINEKIKKDDLKKTLYAMFSQHGAVVDVVALKTVKMRGQAFIVYKDISSATNALRSLQGFTLFEKPMELQYAKGKSYAIAKEDGTYDEVKRKHQEAKTNNKRKESSKSSEPKAKRQKVEKPAARASRDDDQTPNKILFCQNIPADITEAFIADLFRRFHGFKEVRPVPSRPDIAFVEFENEHQAMVAKENLNQYTLSPTHALSVTFAKH